MTVATEAAEKAEMLNIFFALVFTAKVRPQELVTQETRDKAWRKEEFPLVEKDWFRDHLVKLDIQKSTGPDGMHSQVLREQSNIITRLFSIIFEKPWQSEEMPEDWKKANLSFTPVFKKDKKDDRGNYRPTSVPG